MHNLVNMIHALFSLWFVVENVALDSCFCFIHDECKASNQMCYFGILSVSPSLHAAPYCCCNTKDIRVICAFSSEGGH